MVYRQDQFPSIAPQGGSHGFLILSIVLLVVVVIAAMVVGPYLNFEAGDKSKVRGVASIKFFKKSLLSPTEVKFFSTLLKATPNSFIFPQVSLSQLVGIPKGPDRLGSFNRINRMTVDFVVCDGQLNTLVAIELDDRTHDRQSSVERDSKKNVVLSTAGIKLIRIRVEKLPTVEELQEMIEQG